jgi:hypothetical protein
MIAHSMEHNSDRELKVVFADLQLDSPVEADASPKLRLTFSPTRVLDVVVDLRILVNCELLDVVQRNLNANFGLFRRLTETRNFAEIVELQAGHLTNQAAAFVRQSEELTILSIQAIIELVRTTYPRIGENG